VAVNLNWAIHDSLPSLVSRLPASSYYLIPRPHDAAHGTLDALNSFPPFIGMYGLMQRLFPVSCRRRRAQRRFEERQALEMETELAIEDFGLSDVEEILETITEDNHLVFIAATGRFIQDWSIVPLQHENILKFGYTLLVFWDDEIEAIPNFMSVSQNLLTLRGVPVALYDFSTTVS